VRQLKISSDKLTKRTENISRYFTDVESQPMLTPDEETRIGMLAQQGNEAAIEKLISANLRFVVSVAKQYNGQAAMFEDLICQGNIGLCDAARTFDPTRGFKFISYAVWHIRKEILLYLNSNSRTIRVPSNILTDAVKIRRANEQILQEEGRPGTLDELQDAVSKMGKDFTIDHIKRVTSADPKSIPLESDNSDETLSPIDWLSGELSTTELTDDSDLNTAAEIALSRLSNIQRDVVSRRLGIGGDEPDTFSTIAHRYERTPEWARMVYVRSLKIMRAKLNRSQLTHDKVINCEF
jgi:RNA polymerase primary sigma factor